MDITNFLPAWRARRSAVSNRAGACAVLACAAVAQTPTVHFAAPGSAALFNERPVRMLTKT
jgi:hypothetical protein